MIVQVSAGGYRISSLCLGFLYPGQNLLCVSLLFVRYEVECATLRQEAARVLTRYPLAYRPERSVPTATYSVLRNACDRTGAVGVSILPAYTGGWNKKLNRITARRGFSGC